MVKWWNDLPVEWNRIKELIKFKMKQKYEIKAKVIHKPSNKRCIIVATKTEPWKNENDVFNRKEIYPVKHYLIAFFKNVKDDVENYLGVADVLEHELITQDQENY